MWLATVFSLLFFPPVVNSQPENTMVQFYGYPQFMIESAKTSFAANECEMKCANDPSCVFSHTSSDQVCYNFRWSDFPFSYGVRKTSKENGSIVAIKTSRLTECPVSMDDIEFAYFDLRNGVNAAYKWTSDSPGRLDVANKCEKGMPFRRSADVVLCLFPYAKTGINKNSAAGECPTRVRLFGVASVAEIEALTANISGDLWVDGENADCTSASCPVSGYKWTDKFTTTMEKAPKLLNAAQAKCLAIGNGQWYAYDCDATTLAGYVCGRDYYEMY